MKRISSAVLTVGLLVWLTFSQSSLAGSESNRFDSAEHSMPFQQCHCSDILRDGVFEKYGALNTSNYKQKLLTSILSYREEQASGADSGEVNAVVPIDGVPVPVGGKEASNHLKTLKEKYETSRDLELEQTDIDWVETRITSGDIVKAWSKCMSECNGQRGLRAEIESIDKTRFVLKTRWDASLGVNNVKVKDFVVSGARCEPNILTVGKEISSEWVSQPCRRDSNDAVLITLNVVDNNGRDAGTQTPSLAAAVEILPNPLQNLQQEIKEWRTFEWKGDWPRHQTLMEVSDRIPEYKGRRLKYTIKIDSYYNRRPFFYKHRIFVNDIEQGILQSNNYPNPIGIGDDIKTFEGEFLIPADGKVNIKVECVSFDNTISQVDFDIVNSFIKTEFKITVAQATRRLEQLAEACSGRCQASSTIGPSVFVVARSDRLSVVD